MLVVFFTSVANERCQPKETPVRLLQLGQWFPAGGLQKNFWWSMTFVYRVGSREGRLWRSPP